ncbi:transcriptional regulator [Klebsiella pneumoniae]|uniref:Transcriptional regulator n=1 Tax=Klebsiella pneumoniae TaxID=573 RepID=A0A2X1RCN2_KLEPN|nr:transcriptional regulator [Klebsiella pneumoniae]
MQASNIKGTQRWKFQAMIEQDSDYALLTEIAVAYYDQEQTQEEIAKRFGIRVSKSGAC